MPSFGLFIAPPKSASHAVQVPNVEYRAEPYRPSAAVLYTADDPSTGRALGGGLFSNTPSVNDARAVATASSLLTAGLNTVSLPV